MPERVNDVPNRAEWIHEIKHDRAILKCEGRSIGPQKSLNELSRRGQVYSVVSSKRMDGLR